VHYVLGVAGATGALTVETTLRFQPVAFRWAKNLLRYDAPEPKRFVTLFDAMAFISSDQLARATASVR
jgi:hypothetical protein